MDLGLGKKREERMQQSAMDQEFQHDRDMSALNQAGQGSDQNMSPDLVRWEHDLIDEFERIVLFLQSKEQVIDNEGKVSYKAMKGTYLGTKIIDGKERKLYKSLPAIMNEAGINSWKMFVIPMISRNLLMSNFNEEQILRKLKNTTINLITHFAYNQKSYEIDVGNLTMIVRLFKSICEPGAFRSLNSGERNFLSTSTKRLEAISMSEGSNPQNKKSALQSLMG